MFNQCSDCDRVFKTSDEYWNHQCDGKALLPNPPERWKGPPIEPADKVGIAPDSALQAALFVAFIAALPVVVVWAIFR